MLTEVTPPAARSQPSTTILIIEGDTGMGKFLQQLIEEKTPYQTAIINNSQTALEQAQHIQPCLILVDYRLPEINGLDLYDRLQEVEGIRGTPAIMMSATLPTRELEQRGIYQLRKPTDIGSVIRMITHALVMFERQQPYGQHNHS